MSKLKRETPRRSTTAGSADSIYPAVSDALKLAISSMPKLQAETLDAAEFNDLDQTVSGNDSPPNSRIVVIVYSRNILKGFFGFALLAVIIVGALGSVGGFHFNDYWQLIVGGIAGIAGAIIAFYNPKFHTIRH